MQHAVRIQKEQRRFFFDLGPAPVSDNFSHSRTWARAVKKPAVRSFKMVSNLVADIERVADHQPKYDEQEGCACADDNGIRRVPD